MLNPPMKRTASSYLALLICCCFALSLAACGQRGPLFLPQPEVPAGQTETGAGAEDMAEQDAEEKDEEKPQA